MKYKHVFLVWLLADIILGIVSLSFVLLFTHSPKDNDYGMILLVFFYGLAISLPSLLVLLIFHFFYNKRSPLKKNYFIIYIWVILSINFIYLACNHFIFSAGADFNWFYLCTTAAGLLSLYIIHLKIKREEQSRMLT